MKSFGKKEQLYCTGKMGGKKPKKKKKVGGGLVGLKAEGSPGNILKNLVGDGDNGKKKKKTKDVGATGENLV